MSDGDNGGDARVRMFNEMMSRGLTPMEYLKQEERKRKENEERKRNEDEERKRKENEERKIKEDEERKKKENEESKSEQKRELTLAERMASIVNTSQAIKTHTDKGKMPPGLAEYAQEKGMTPEEITEFLVFQERLATGAFKINMHSDGKGFDMGPN